tara:strand:+ start:1451 stop:1687 length:237 start_codon:yes stop_codon:yes gene_type:complete
MADSLRSTLLRTTNLKIDLKDLKAHQRIIGDGTFDKQIKKEENKNKLRNIEDIFDKGKIAKKKPKPKPKPKPRPKPYK